MERSMSMQISEAEAVARVNSVVTPEFVNQMLARIRQMVHSLGGVDEIRRFLAQPGNYLDRAGIPGYGELSSDARQTVERGISDAAREAIALPETSSDSEAELSSVIECIVCVVALAFLTVFVLVIVGIAVAMFIKVAAAVIAPLAAALGILAGVIAGMSGAAVFNLVSALIGAGVFILALMIGLVVQVCPCRKLDRQDDQPEEQV
jgi:hypothetical protein